MDLDNQLQQAFDSISLVDLLHRLGYPEARRGAGQKSIFRADKKAGSVQITDTWYKDYACDEHDGGHLWAIMHVRNCSKKEAVEYLYDVTGIVPQKQSAGAVKAIQRDKRETVYGNHEKKVALLPKLGMEEPGPMAALVLDCWQEGLAEMLPMAGKISECRGWSERVMLELVAQGKTGLPRLPWSSGQDKKRGWGWLVEKPIFKGNQAALVPVGFHARYKIYKAGQFVEKRWVYVPYVPQAERLSDFQAALKKAKIKLPAYPFVLGELVDPKLVIITEGQFDAVSMAEAFGWLGGEGLPPGVVILGLRGVSSPSVVLAAYGAWLRKHRPFVWILPDNDAAGKQLFERKNFERIDWEPCFVDRLRAQGCTVFPQLIEVEGCKDFNDIWRAHRPALVDMRKLAAVAGCLDLVNGGGK